jgi:hypothetical protein
MKFKANFKVPVLDASAYKRYLSQYLEDWLKQAAIFWLDATVGTTIEIIPTWSKASRATFQKLAEAVGTHIRFGPQKSFKDRESLGDQESEGGVEIDSSAGRFYFKYGTSLQYLTYNEYNKAVRGEAPGVFSSRGIPNTPYHFQEKGREAFDDFTRFTELPSPFLFLKYIKV